MVAITVMSGKTGGRVMLARKCDICGAEMRITTPRYKVTFDGWLYTEEIDICMDCFERIADEIRQADISQTKTQNSNLTFEKAGEPQIGEMMTEEEFDSMLARVLTGNNEPQTYITEDRDTQILDAWQVHHRNTTSVEDEPQTDCYVSDLCKHYGDKQICGRCRSRNLFCEAEPQPRCPKCGKRGYIRSLESMGVKLKVFDEYKWKCTNCNKYFKEEPKDEPQTERSE